MPVMVKIENHYECGRNSESIVLVPAPAGEVGDWWQEVVWDLTGDGHECGEADDALYEASIVAAPGREDLVGQTMSWGG